MRLLSADEHEARMALYEQGLTDEEIAAERWVTKESICGWRTKRRLPSNGKKGGHLPKEKHNARMALYEQGLTDEKIAAELSMSKSAICCWRKKNGLPAQGNICRRPLNQNQDKALLLYQQGLHDKEIAKVFGVHRSTVAYWRIKQGLPINSSTGTDGVLKQ